MRVSEMRLTAIAIIAARLCAYELQAPSLRTGNRAVDQAFRIAIGDLAGNIVLYRSGLLNEARPVLLAGLGYPTPWTRDASMNAWNGLSLLAPAVARNTLLAVLDEGPVIRGGDQYWDAIVWATGAWQHYLATGDREFLALALPAVERTLGEMEAAEFDAHTGLFRGPGWSDGISGYPDAYAGTQGASGVQAWPKVNRGQASHPGFGIPMQALSTNCLYYNAYRVVGWMRAELGLRTAPEAAAKARNLKEAINRELWSGTQYRFLTGPLGRSEHQEALGQAYAVLFGIADAERARLVLANQHVAPAGVPCLWPPLQRYPEFARHAGTVWPQIQGMWAQAAAMGKRPEIFGHELLTLAAHAVRDRQFAEIYHPVSGEIYGGWQERKGELALWTSQPRQSWAASAFVRMVVHGLAGVELLPEGVRFAPCVPAGVGTVELSNLHVRDAVLCVTVRGVGSTVGRMTVDGRAVDPGAVVPWSRLGAVEIAMADGEAQR